MSKVTQDARRTLRFEGLRVNVFEKDVDIGEAVTVLEIDVPIDDVSTRAFEQVMSDMGMQPEYQHAVMQTVERCQIQQYLMDHHKG